jgi:S-adenosyl-L-methionine hydrolase (adenosine-forming)
MLKRSFQFFPLGTIFLCIVDPEVGSERKILYIRSRQFDFIAPDNGLLWMTANDLDIEKMVTLDNYEFFINKTPSTFEGRDKMAPVAGYSSLGIEPTQFGTIKSGMVKLELPEAVSEKDLLIGEIIYFDSFGNAITNISFANLMENEAVNLPVVLFNGTEVGHIVSTFADAVNGSALAYFGSSGYLELAVNHGNFHRMLNSKPGDKVIINYG